MRFARVAIAASVALLGVVAACEDDATAPETITYVATLNGANERPNPNASTATGVGTYTLTGNTLTYTVTVNGLTTPANAAHIHIGGAAAAGPVLFGFTHSAVQTGQVASGTINLSQPVGTGANPITGDSMRVLLNNGNLYTNVHNTTFPGGEVRGQLIRRP